MVFPATPERPGALWCGWWEDDALVLAKIVEAPRCSTAIEVRRCGAQDRAVDRELPGDELRIRGLGVDPDAEIEPLVAEIGGASVAARQLDPDLRIALVELGDGGHQLAHC